MLEPVNKYLTPSHFADEVRSQKAVMLYVFALSGMGVELVYLITLIFAVSDLGYSLLRSGLVIIWTTGILWLVRRGWEWWASWLFSLGGWGLITLLIVTHGVGSISPFFGAYIILSLATGLLLGSRNGLALGALSLATCAWFIYADKAGLLPSPVEPMTPFLSWFIMATLFIMAAVVLHLAVSNMAHALARAQQTEQALGESERRYRIISEMTSDYAFSFRFGLEGQLVLEWISEAFTRITGYTRFEFNQLGWLHLIYQDDIATLQNQVELLRSGHPAMLVGRVVTKSGEIRWLQTYSRPIWDETHSRVTGFYGASQDITERKQSVEKLQQSEKKAHSLLRLAKLLEQTVTYDQIMAALFTELPPILGYHHLWLYLVSPDGEAAVLMADQHRGVPQATDQLQRLTISNDLFLEEIVQASHIVVVEDALTDPRTNKEIVALNQNRTLVNVPILLDKQHMGILGMGTFGQEGVKLPDPSQLDYLNAAANHVAVTLNRVQFLAEREQNATALQELNLQLEQRVAERTAELAQAHRWRQALLQTIPDEVWLKDQVGRYVMVNKAFLRWHRLTLPQILGKTDAELHPEQWQTFTVEDATVLISGQPLRFDQSMVDETGRQHWFEIIKVPVLDEQNRPFGVVGISHNITERKQAELALRLSEARYRSLFENSPVALWQEDLSLVKCYLDELRHSGVTDFEQYFEQHPEVVAHCASLIRVLDVNKVAISIEGVTDKSVLMDNLSQIFEIKIPAHFQQELVVIAAGKLSYQNEGSNCNLAGKLVHYRVGWSVTPGYEADLSNVNVFVIDITEQRQIEMELRQYHDHLEERVALRTAELSQLNQQLELEISERKRVLQDKEVLLQEIHHRVKNNLQVVSSLLDLQARYLKDEASREIFKESQHRIRSMALVHERLYQSPDLTRINLADYVNSLTDHLLQVYHNQNGQIHLRREIEPLSVSIETAIPCGLIINELISNILKHAFPDRPNGEIWLEFRAANGQLMLRIGDNGVGLPAHIDFRRTKSLGLTLVMTLVKQLKGTIELNNKNGSEFCISFPEAGIDGKMSPSA